MLLALIRHKPAIGNMVDIWKNVAQLLVPMQLHRVAERHYVIVHIIPYHDARNGFALTGKQTGRRERKGVEVVKLNLVESQR
jgi:hypothetical protein